MCVCNRTSLVSREPLDLLGGIGETEGGEPRAAQARETMMAEGRLGGPGRGWALFSR